MKTKTSLFLGNVRFVNLKENGNVNLENQVCSLELSKELKELGVKHESLFWYTVYVNQTYDIHYQFDSKHIPPAHYSAFTVAELGELLPDFIEIERDCYFSNDKYLWRVQSPDHETFNENEANARAEMLVYLLENKLMEL